MKTIAIVGSTGSIGETSLKVFSKNKKKFKLIFLSAHRNYKKLIAQSKKYNPKNIFLTNEKFYKKIKSRKLIKLKNIFNNSNKIDYVISGASGYDALDLNIKLLKISKNLLIANKETIICGGDTFLNLAKKNNCKIVPIDSEHHCIDFFMKNFLQTKKIIKKIYLIASGGPFYEKKIKYNEKINNVVKHPVWSMGKTISVNSSNFSNKVLEMFEAKILFNLPPEKIDILVERKSMAHAIIQLENNIFFPIVHYPKMEIAISNSLKIQFYENKNLDNISLNFSKPKNKKFPLVHLGHKILKKYSNSGMIIFTVFNERLVDLYLAKKIMYGDIVANLVKLFNKKTIIAKSKIKINSIKDIKSILNFAKNYKL